MPRLHNSEIDDLMAEDHTCEGCGYDRMDCVCIISAYEDAFNIPDYEEDVPSFDDVDTGDPYYAEEDLSYLDVEWYEADRMPLIDDQSY